MCLRTDLPPHLRREDGTPRVWSEITSPPDSIVIPCEYIQDMNGSEYRSATTPKPLHPFFADHQFGVDQFVKPADGVDIGTSMSRSVASLERTFLNHKKSPSRIGPVPPGQPSSFVWAKVARIPLYPLHKKDPPVGRALSEENGSVKPGQIFSSWDRDNFDRIELSG